MTNSMAHALYVLTYFGAYMLYVLTYMGQHSSMVRVAVQ